MGFVVQFVFLMAVISVTIGEILHQEQSSAGSHSKEDNLETLKQMDETQESNPTIEMAFLLNQCLKGESLYCDILKNKSIGDGLKAFSDQTLEGFYLNLRSLFNVETDENDDTDDNRGSLASGFSNCEFNLENCEHNWNKCRNTMKNCNCDLSKDEL